MQSLSALGHYDFRQPGHYSYETAMSACQQLHLGQQTVAQLYTRMIFNVVARNQDDHTRNISFLMDRHGRWRLAPAFDVIWSYNPKGEWTNRHQMSINGKLEGFERQDLIDAARRYHIKKPLDVLAEVGSAVRRWPEFAEKAGVEPERIHAVATTHRLHLLPG
jgi:serine/threonine-protein kinase HipA